MTMKKEKLPLHQLLEAIDTPRFEGLKEHFTQLFTPTFLRKGRVLVDIGQVNNAIYFIKSGVIRSYYLKGSEDITSRLIAEGEIACVAESFFSQQESDEVMETLEDTMVYSISYEGYRKMAQEDILIAQLIIQLLEQRLVSFSERVRLFKYLSVEKRIEYYINQPYSLFRRVPDHYIATYLGTTSATFSRCLKTASFDKIQH
ncbi:Crp/Fnr family transcriptional regulator [Dyadobacter luteus]|uniref:Crp/Fnr family transcriptional regulator n=2 Tax=Dyadobacter luteus TaxID=2259619 RepID=A0A3D8YB44_9BACT|nr:Crp/Fnr family transcriptional regulator [Dyadobacter luteus]